jgi:MipA family protein
MLRLRGYFCGVRVRCLRLRGRRRSGAEFRLDRHAGAEGRILPSYEGSSRYIVAPFPLFEARQADAPRAFRSARDGASIGILETGHFRAGPTLKIDLPRREDDDANLRGLGDVDWAFELGGFVEYWPAAWLRTRMELRQGIGGHDGQGGDLSPMW